MSRPRPLQSWTATLLVALLALAAIVLANTTAPAASAAHPHAAAPYAPGVVIVGFRAHTSATASRSALARTGIERPSTPLAPFATVALRRGVSVASAIARLRRRAAVAWAVPDYIAHAAQVPPPFIPNDPGDAGKPGGWEALQWNFAGPYGVNAPQAWANVAAAGHPGGAGVIIAVLDTGVAYTDHGHFRRSPDFRPGEFVQGYDFVAHSPFPEDRNGHGTQVAGTIAEATNNGLGVTGLAYGARLMPVRVLDSQGDGDASAIAKGIYYAVHHHAQISIFVTTTSFTEPARRLAQQHNIQLVDGASLVDLMSHLQLGGTRKALSDALVPQTLSSNLWDR